MAEKDERMNYDEVAKHGDTALGLIGGARVPVTDEDVESIRSKCKRVGTDKV